MFTSMRHGATFALQLSPSEASQQRIEPTAARPRSLRSAPCPPLRCVLPHSSASGPAQQLGPVRPATGDALRARAALRIRDRPRRRRFALARAIAARDGPRGGRRARHARGVRECALPARDGDQ
eukprot:229417-Prymnesium_polylepis.1